MDADGLTFAVATTAEERVAKRLGLNTVRVGVSVANGVPEGSLVSFGLAGSLGELRIGDVLDATRVVDATGATTYAGDPDADAVTEQTGVAVDARLKHGDRIPVGEQVLEVIALAGHTPGSVALLYDDPDGHPHVFTGDSLFPGGVGKTVGADNFTSLLDDVTTRVFDVLPDDTWVYPGHGFDTTLGVERPHLDEWRARGW